MISAALHSLLVTGVLAFLLEFLARPFLGGARRRRLPGPVLALALLLGAAIMAARGPAVYTPLEAGSPSALPCVVIGGLLLFALTLKSDLRLPSSRRHFLGTMGGALLLFLGGLRIPFVGIPGAGLTFLDPVTVLVLTLLWVFLFVSMIEICAMLPLLAGFVALGVGLIIFLPLGVKQTFPGQVLCGALIGALLGRFLGELAQGQTRPPDKTETLILGYFAAAATLSTFVKSIALAGFIVPLAVLTIVIIILLIHSFERSVILRSSPRA
jgi:hypothetical protein